MSRGHYRVKLYAPFPDTVHFPRRLADVLDVSEEEALLMLHQLPVVVAHSVNEEVAEELAAQLRSINAHCLVETEGGAETEEEPPRPISPVARQAAARALTIESKETLRFRLWLGVAAAAVAALAGLVAVGYLTTHLDFSSKRGSSTQPAKARAVGEPRALSEEEKRRGVDLEEDIDGLSDRFSELVAQRALLEKEVMALDHKLGADPFEVRRKKRELNELREKIAGLNARIQGLKKDLESIRRAQEGATRER